MDISKLNEKARYLTGIGLIIWFLALFFGVSCAQHGGRFYIWIYIGWFGLVPGVFDSFTYLYSIPAIIISFIFLFTAIIGWIRKNFIFSLIFLLLTIISFIVGIYRFLYSLKGVH